MDQPDELQCLMEGGRRGEGQGMTDPGQLSETVSGFACRCGGLFSGGVCIPVQHIRKSLHGDPAGFKKYRFFGNAAMFPGGSTDSLQDARHTLLQNSRIIRSKMVVIHPKLRLTVAGDDAFRLLQHPIRYGRADRTEGPQHHIVFIQVDRMQAAEGLLRVCPGNGDRIAIVLPVSLILINVVHSFPSLRKRDGNLSLQPFQMGHAASPRHGYFSISIIAASVEKGMHKPMHE